MIVFRKTTETKTKYYSKEIITFRKLLLIAMMIATIARFQGVMMLQERMWISSDFYYR